MVSIFRTHIYSVLDVLNHLLAQSCIEEMQQRRNFSSMHLLSSKLGRIPRIDVRPLIGILVMRFCIVNWAQIDAWPVGL